MSRSKARSKLAMAVTVPVVVATMVLLGVPQLAFGATPLPVVLSFTASRTTIRDVGGKIVLRASLRYAASCEMTVSPSLKGFPASFTCSSDRVTKAVVLRSNKSPSPISYTFGLELQNASGTATATNVVVTEGAAPPPISFTPPPPGNPTTLVFPAEGVFVADNPISVTVKNNSSSTQLITSVAMGTVGDPNDFSLPRNNCGYITAHATCSLAVQFDPTGAGLRTEVVNLLDASWGASGTTVHLKLRGTGVWATATVSNSHVRNNVLVFPTDETLLKASAPQSVTVTNVGAVPLYISGMAVTGGEATDFLAAPDTCINELVNPPVYPLIVSIGQSCTFTLEFDPSGTGERTSSVVVADNTLGTETELGVEGTGVAAPS
ncbi:MAG: choice-of-anchor D domain-containing protein [Acidimicrobiales bacterium]|jgi:hypothetical protein